MRTCVGGRRDDGLGRPAGRDQDARAARREQRAAQLADSCSVIFECVEYRIVAAMNAIVQGQPVGARGRGSEGKEEGQRDPEQTPLLGGVR